VVCERLRLSADTLRRWARQGVPGGVRGGEARQPVTDWPRCPNCGDYALEGRATCGRARCDEVCPPERSEKVTERIHVNARRKPF
jgi:hypothetical protein